MLMIPTHVFHGRKFSPRLFHIIHLSLPLFVSFQCRHLYYGQEFGTINRINLDGGDIASDVVIVSRSSLYDISGITVDHHLNLLYWAVNDTNTRTIMYLNMTEWNHAYGLMVDPVS